MSLRWAGVWVVVGAASQKGQWTNVVVQPQQVADHLVRLADRGGGQRAELVRLAVEDEQVEQAAPRARGFALLAAADHPVERVALKKIELDEHVGLPLVDQVVVAAHAGLAPQRPGDRVQQR